MLAGGGPAPPGGVGATDPSGRCGGLPAIARARPALRLSLALSIATGAALAACGGGSAAVEGACAPEVMEALDPGSARHVLPGGPEPPYTSDPPTSGAHLPGSEAQGALRQPLARPEQVAVLEEGGVLVQYRDLADRERRRLEGLAAEDVVVAPNDQLDAPVVATAWRYRLRCTAVDPGALQRFVDAHRGGGPGP
jgi:hypothetical protein